MGSNWFSDLLKPTADYINSIPIIGQVVEKADKLAANTDLSHLGTAAIGKIIGGDFEDRYTSEEARTGAAHVIGTAALAYLLGGVGGGAGAIGESSASAMAASEAGGAGGTAVGSLASGEAAGAITAEQAAAAMYASEVGGAGGTAVGSLAGAGESGISEVLSDLAQRQLISQMLSGVDQSKPIMTGGYSNQRVTPRQDLPANDLAAIMKAALGPDESTAKVDGSGVTVNDGLRRSFMGNSLSSSNSSLISTKPGGSLSSIDLSTEPKTKSLGLKNISVTSPFYQASSGRY